MTSLPDTFAIYPLTEKAVTVELGNSIDPAILGRVNALDRTLTAHPFMGMETTVPAYSTLTVFFDPALVKRSSQLKGENCFDRVKGYILQLSQSNVEAGKKQPDSIEIPVCYGGSYGPDLWEVAHLHRISEEEVIRMHSSVVYTVYMIGFMPGFAYLGGLVPGLESPRRAVPRKLVEAGAVGIAGKQTGIYPLGSPGGWQLIGRTPLKMFDAKRAPAALLKAGDRLRFVPISFHDFEAYANGAAY